jgi:hypothetical protein
MIGVFPKGARFLLLTRPRYHKSQAGRGLPTTRGKMNNIGQNSPNVGHVFHLCNLDSRTVMDVVLVAQVSHRSGWEQNRRICQRYLNARLGECPLYWEHSGTGPLEDMQILEDTIRQSLTVGV